jgi:peroxiredoxin
LKQLFIFTFALLCAAPILTAQTQQANLNFSPETIIKDSEGNVIDFDLFLKLTENPRCTIQPMRYEGAKLKEVMCNCPKSVIAANRIPVSSTITKTEVTAKPKETLTIAKPIAVVATANTVVPDKNQLARTKDLEGKKPPFFGLPDMTGNWWDLANQSGKIVLLKFWFTNCTPCIEEMPELNKLVEEFKGNPEVVFIAPAVDEKDKTEAFLKKRTFNYTVLPEAYDLTDTYAVQGYPTHVVIGKDGKVAKVITGQNSQIFRTLRGIIRLELMRNDGELIREVHDGEPVTADNGVPIFSELGALIQPDDYERLLRTGKYKVFKRHKKTKEVEILLLPFDKY